MTKTNITSERPDMVLTAEEKTAWITMYNSERKLPSTRVPCTVTGKGIVMFGDNLHARVIKYGGIENLLDTFTCREARVSATSVVKEQIALIKAERKAMRTAKREAKITLMQAKKNEKLVETVPTETVPTLKATKKSKKVVDQPATVD